MLKICALLFAVAMCGGCESTAIYHYDGILYDSDGHTPLARVPVEILPSLDEQPTAGTAGTDERQFTDAAGHVKGSITIITEKIFVKKDQIVPPLKTVYVFVHAKGDWQKITVPLDDSCQKEATTTDRTVHLPPIILPGPGATSETAE